MTEFITTYLQIMFSGVQEFCICCTPFGLVMMFTGKVAPVRYKAVTPRKPAKRNPNQKRKQRKPNPNTKAKTAKKQEQKPWHVAPPLSPQQQAEYSKYWAKSRGVKDDSWAGFGAPE